MITKSNLRKYKKAYQEKGYVCQKFIDKNVKTLDWLKKK